MPSAWLPPWKAGLQRGTGSPQLFVPAAENDLA